MIKVLTLKVKYDTITAILNQKRREEGNGKDLL
jgi:hypothetical protein